MGRPVELRRPRGRVGQLRVTVMAVELAVVEGVVNSPLVRLKLSFSSQWVEMWCISVNHAEKKC